MLNILIISESGQVRAVYGDREDIRVAVLDLDRLPFLTDRQLGDLSLELAPLASIEQGHKLPPTYELIVRVDERRLPFGLYQSPTGDDRIIRE